MVAAFKVEKNTSNSKYYITPTAALLNTYQAKDFPFCYTNLIVGCYNFSIKKFYQYIISKFDAKISIEKTYPYFKTYFNEKSKAEEFCKELNERAYQQQLV